MSVTSKEKVIAKLENNKAYRDAYVAEHVKTSVPLQIYHLREARELTQHSLQKKRRRHKQLYHVWKIPIMGISH